MFPVLYGIDLPTLGKSAYLGHIRIWGLGQLGMFTPQQLQPKYSTGSGREGRKHTADGMQFPNFGFISVQRGMTPALPVPGPEHGLATRLRAEPRVAAPPPRRPLRSGQCPPRCARLRFAREFGLCPWGPQDS